MIIQTYLFDDIVTLVNLGYANIIMMIIYSMSDKWV